MRCSDSRNLNAGAGGANLCFQVIMNANHDSRNSVQHYREENNDDHASSNPLFKITN